MKYMKKTYKNYGHGEYEDYSSSNSSDDIGSFCSDVASHENVDGFDVVGDEKQYVRRGRTQRFIIDRSN